MKKKILIGLIIGSLLFASTSLGASIYNVLSATFPILINGEEWEDGNKAVVIDGTTYLPLKLIGEALNIDVKWNNELDQVEIETIESEESTNDEELYDEDYWLNYYENYYNEIFSELYGETEVDEENVEIEEDATNEETNETESTETKATEKAYIGNKKTKKLHLATCPSAQKLLEENREYFSDISEATGYTKCKMCNP